MKHRWILREDGSPDEFAFESGFHNGVICEDCGKSVCVCCHPDYVEMDDCPGPPTPKTMTNADHIRSMNDKDLAEFLAYTWATPVRAWKQDSGEVLSWLQEKCNND